MKNAISADAARLLRKAVKHILEEPKRYDQNETLVKVKSGTPFYYTSLGDQTAPKCGTIGCLAGWITFLTAKNPFRISDPIYFAAQKLGLNHSWNQTWSLFGSIENWPYKFRTAYLKAKTPQGIARVVARRVEYFIKTGN